MLVHCNSFGDPFAAYQAYQSKWATPDGTPCTLWYGCSRWKNEEFDSLIAKMEAVPADAAQDSEYMDWSVRLTELYLENLPEIILTDEYHTMTYNEHYWTGYATKEDPYVAPFYCCWDAGYLYLFHLKPTGASSTLLLEAPGGLRPPGAFICPRGKRGPSAPMTRRGSGWFAHRRRG